MNPWLYLLIAFVAIMTISAWALIASVRRARDGFEDEQGFHLGPTPPRPLAMPAPVAGSEVVVSVTPAKPRRRRSSSSRSPIPAVSASPFEETVAPASKRRTAKKTVDSNPPITAGTQALIKGLVGETTMQ